MNTAGKPAPWAKLAPFYDDLKACEYDTGFCKADGNYETACKTEKERYDNCKK